MANLAAALLSFKETQTPVAVIGLGVSGIETVLFLLRQGIPARAIEKTSREKYLVNNVFAGRIAELESQNVPISFGLDGEHVAPLLDGVKLAVISPGVSLESAIAGTLKRRGIQIVGEFELGLELSGKRIIGVTGSNGKTTTATLIDYLLRQAGKDSVLRGNVGTPVIADIESLNSESHPDELIVAEGSSYQLESCTVLKPRIGVFLNLSDNHLERHGTLSRYFAAKAQLFERQDKDDFAIVNYDDEYGKSLLGRIKSRVVLIGRDVPWGRDSIKINYSAGDDSLVARVGNTSFTVNCKGALLQGIHNRYNMAAAVAVGAILNIDPATIGKACRDFRPLSHRLETVGTYQSITWINDSKSTTVASTAAAVSAIESSYPARTVILLIGGLMKAGSWAPLFQIIGSPHTNVKKVICFGKDARVLSDQCQASDIAHVEVATLLNAIEKATELSRENDIVLLSPGCASFDEFRSFEERGEYFRKFIVGSPNA